MKIFWFCILFLQTVSSQSSPESSMSTQASKCEKWNCLNREFGDKFQTRNKAIKELKSTVSPHLWKSLVRDVVNICFENYTAPADYENSCDHSIYSCVIETFIEMCPERYIKEGKICSTIDCEDDTRTTMCKQRHIKYRPNLSANITDEYNYRKCCSLGIIFDPSVMARCGLVSEVYHQNVRIHFPTDYHINSTSETFIYKTDEDNTTDTSDSDTSAHHYGGAIVPVPSDIDEHVYRYISGYDYGKLREYSMAKNKNENVSLYYPYDSWNVNETRFYEDRHAVNSGNSKRLIAEIPLIIMTIRSFLLVCLMQ